MILISDTFLDNSAINGGAIYNDNVVPDSTVIIIGSAFTDNYASANGGGLNNDGTATVIDSTFISNYATDGGGIYNPGTLIVIGSVFSNNTGSDIYP